MEAVLAAVEKRELTEKEIEAKCRKVLKYKYALGLERNPMYSFQFGTRINTPKTRDLMRRLNLAAITVLDNRDEVLPLDPSIGEVAVLNVGEAQEIRPFLKELSQYTRPVEFHLGKNLPEADGNRLRNALAKYKRILVCVTEHRLTPYQNFFAKFAPDVPVVYLFFIPGKQVLQINKGTLLLKR